MIHKYLIINSPKKLLKVLALLSTVSFLLFLHFIAPRFITEVKNPLTDLLKPIEVNKYTNEPLKPPSEIMTFQGLDNIKISCLLNYSQLDSAKGTIILLHGIRSNKESFNEVSNRLSQRGYNTISVDLRGHGNSEGQFCTFGVKEKIDIINLLDILYKSKKFNKRIGIWGKSLGGAIALQTMALDKRIKFGIIESTFTDFPTITEDYFLFHFGFNISPLTQYLVYRAGKISDFNPQSANPKKHCQNITNPVLMVHGDQDKRIKIEYGYDNYNSLSSKNKEFIKIKGANHLNVHEIGGESYFNKVLKFIEKQ